jgi:diguanylate cyclase (GGDEF)-like protein
VVNPPHACLLLTREGQEFPINMSAAPIRHRDGHIAGVIVVFHLLHQDSLERRGIASHFSEQISEQTLDLYPRPIFEQLLSNLLRAFSLNQVEENYLLLYLESDLFKTVYSRYGQAASELLWQQWTGLIKKRIRYDDMLTRLNHQHVAILLKNCAPHQADSVCQHILETMQDFEFIWQQQRFRGTLAIGAVAVSAEYGRVDELLQRAEQACQVARDNPKLHCYVALSHANEARNAPAISNPISVHQYWQNEVKQALSEQRLFLYQQAIVILSNRQILGTEILLRLQNAEQQWIEANAFLPLLHHPQQLMQLDRWMIQQTLAHFSHHREQLPEGCLISFNLSADTLTDLNFAEFLRQELRQFKLKPWQFCFEISETSAHVHQEIMVDFIKSLRQLGCQVALDEFNHQTISLLRLREWPINYLKLDGRWLDTIHDDNFAEHLLMSIYDLCQLLRIHLVATQVENETTLALLQRLNIPFAQGLLLAAPTPLQ